MDAFTVGLGEQIQGLFPALGLEDPVAFLGQGLSQRTADPGLVVHDEDGGEGAHE